MPTTVKEFEDGSSLEFDQGGFDSYCVYERTAAGTRRAPLDTDYFETLVEFGVSRGADAVYRDFVRVYDATSKDVSDDVLVLIDEVASDYGTDAMRASKTLTTMYMGMIAEENKRYTKLGKRVKRLGTHVLLQEGLDVGEAANFMRGMKWQEIDKLCRERGF